VPVTSPRRPRPGRAWAALLQPVRLLAVAGFAALAAPPGAAQEAPGQAARKAQPCAVCHGHDGIGTSPLFPNLAGQKSLYLAKVLREYRAGRRNDPVMTIAARDLTDDDIDTLAEYYEGLDRQPAR
jgi:cytochrome c553